MIRSLRLFLLLFCVSVCAVLPAQNTLRFGYCPDEFSSAAVAEPVSDSGSRMVLCAIKLPGSRLQFVKGQKLTKIRFAVQDGMTGTYVWVRPSLEKPSTLPLTRVGTTVDGWQEVTLKEPYVITGEDIVIGYSGTLPGGKGIYFDGKTNANACFVGNGAEWQDLSEYDMGSLCIQGIVESDETVPTSDVAIESCTFDRVYSKIGEPTTATVGIANYGTETVTAPTLYYTLASGQEVTVPVEGTIASNETKLVTVSLNTDACKEGFNDLKLRIDPDDGYAPNNEYSLQIACYATSYTHKSLIEHFTTLVCVNCPAGHAVLNKLTADRDDYVWVAHHVGYGTDELTVNSSNTIYSIAAVSGAPFAMFDRRILSGVSYSNKAPAFGIGYGDANYGANFLKPSFDYCVNTAAFMSVNIDNKYDDDTRTLTTTVSGERNSLLSLFYPEQNLSVQLVEDRVETEAAQVGSGEKVHSHVFRTSLTPIVGEELTWDGNTYTRTYTYEIPEGWNAKNLRVVAFAAIPPVSGDSRHADVINANEQPVVATSAGITSTTRQDVVLDRTYYDIDGRRITAPTQGVYLERVTTTDGVKTYKRMR